MKALAVVFIVLALVVGILPMFTDCESQGGMLTLPNGKLISMKCHWAGRAELATAAPLFLVGAMLPFSRRKESQRVLSLLAIAIGALVILLPWVLIGVCSNPEMICNSIMRPALTLSGALIVAAGLIGLFTSVRGQETAA